MNPANYSRPVSDASTVAALETPGDASSTALRVPDDFAGMRLDQALAQLLPEHSRSRLKMWIDAGRVTIGGVAWDAKRRVAGGERVDVSAAAHAQHETAAAEDIALDIAFEDASIIVLRKPAGLVVHPGNGNQSGTLLNALLHHHPALAGLPRAGIVHRLDKDTSGLLVVAKTAVAHTDLVRQLAARTVAREYVAVARGDVARATIVDAPIGRHPMQRTTMAVVAKGKPARTHVRVVERYGAATLLRCTLETGRTHQIRVHLAAIGHPLVGDRAYGPGRAAGVPDFPRQALHAAKLGFDHPLTGQAMAWEAAPPIDLATLIETLRAMRASSAR